MAITEVPCLKILKLLTASGFALTQVYEDVSLN